MEEKQSLPVNQKSKYQLVIKYFCVFSQLWNIPLRMNFIFHQKVFLTGAEKQFNIHLQFILFVGCKAFTAIVQSIWKD